MTNTHIFNKLLSFKHFLINRKKGSVFIFLFISPFLSPLTPVSCRGWYGSSCLHGVWNLACVFKERQIRSLEDVPRVKVFWPKVFAYLF